MKKTAFFLSLMFCASSLVAEVDMSDEKYDVEVVTRIDTKSIISVPSREDGVTKTIDLDSLQLHTEIRQLDRLMDGEMYNINSRLMNEYIGARDGKGNKIQIALLLAAITDAITANYSLMFKSYSEYVNDLTAKTIDKEKFDDLKSDFDTNKKNNERHINQLKTESKRFDADIVNLQADLNSLSGQLKDLRTISTDGMSDEKRKALMAEITKLVNDKVAAALNLDLIQKAASKQKEVVFVGGGGSIADFNFTNAVVSISKYLGAGNEVNTNGVTFVPPNIDGSPATDVIAYLNSKGVVGYSDGSSEETNSPFTSSFTFVSTNGTDTLTAPFIAPANWADGKTVIVTNGCFSMRSTSAWAYYDGSFHNCEVQIGSTTIHQSVMSYSTSGSVYAIVTYGGSGGSTMELSPIGNSLFGVSVSFKVGELVLADDGSLYSTYQPSGRFVITCYE